VKDDMESLNLHKQLIRKKVVAKRLGVSTRMVERLVNSGKFPPPIKIGGLVCFVESEVGM